MRRTYLKITVWLIISMFSFGFYVNALAQSPYISVSWTNNQALNAVNVAPGKEYIQSAIVENHSNSNQKLGVLVSNLKGDINLAEFVDFSVAVKSNEIINEVFKGFAEKNNETFLTEIESKSQIVVNFKLALKNSTNNNFQNKNLGFDLVLGYIALDSEFTPLSTFRAGGSQEVLEPSQEETLDSESNDQKKSVAGNQTTQEAGVKDKNYNWIYGLIIIGILLFLGIWMILRRSKQEKEEEKN